MNSYELAMAKREARESTAALSDLQQKYAQAVDDRGWSRIFDFHPQAWQQHAPYNTEESVLAYPAVFACSTLIESDIGKMPFIAQQEDGNIWKKVKHDILSLLKRPNKYQNHIQFKRNWMNSKLVHGNTYCLKVRDGRKIAGLVILDPLKVAPLVSDMGEVFYRLDGDQLADIEQQIVVPASEIIHDRFNCLYHPLVGLSPIFACGASATMGLSLLKNSKNFFRNGSNPSGILAAPGAISNETASRLKELWESKYSGENSGKIAVVGDDLKYTPMRMSNIDAQVIEHFKFTSETICSAYHVPADMVGFGTPSTFNNAEVKTLQYYSQCLQVLIEEMEECLNQGLGIEENMRIQLDLLSLFRMDQSTLMDVLQKGVSGTILASNEARERLNLPPVNGGEAPLSQQQYYSLEALAERDATNPLAVAPVPAVPAPEPTPEEDEDTAKVFSLVFEKELNLEPA